MPSFSYSRGSNAHVDIEGLTDFIRDCKAIEGDLDKVVIERGKRMGKAVVQRARLKAATDKQRAKAARTLRVTSSARGVIVSGGGVRAKYFWGAEFGGKRMTRGRKLAGGSMRGTQKKFGGFDHWTGNQFQTGWSDAPGYFLNPAVNEISEREWQEYKDDLERIYGQAFQE